MCAHSYVRNIQVKQSAVVQTHNRFLFISLHNYRYQDPKNIFGPLRDPIKEKEKIEALAAQFGNLFIFIFKCSDVSRNKYQET